MVHTVSNGLFRALSGMLLLAPMTCGLVACAVSSEPLPATDAGGGQGSFSDAGTAPRLEEGDASTGNEGPIDGWARIDLGPLPDATSNCADPDCFGADASAEPGAPDVADADPIHDASADAGDAAADADAGETGDGCPAACDAGAP